MAELHTPHNTLCEQYDEYIWIQSKILPAKYNLSERIDHCLSHSCVCMASFGLSLAAALAFIERHSV